MASSFLITIIARLIIALNMNMSNIEHPPIIDRAELTAQLRAILMPYRDTKPRRDPDLSDLLPEIKQAIAEEMLLYTRGNQSKAARLLGINRKTLRDTYRKLPRL
ncbi:helix-turn-helix domain-containing protein [Vibrio jasicida]|uniref:helix-turn-helix domain-containing protein n=1 Tax=Vibrio jasicida TaxID=766224 RepID=UPI0006970785|nr:helix-turn-helix domain-containing protein [Vibrio jasicida]